MTTTTTEPKTGKRNDLLRKVQGLIDTADSYEATGNAEAAQTYRQKADQLMTDYAVESFELSMAADAKGAKAGGVPEVRTFDFSASSHEVAGTLRSMFTSLVTHCRCMGVGYDKGNYQDYRVIGFAGDLDYLEMLYLSLRIDLSAKLVPQPEATDFSSSIASLKTAGRKWAQIYESLRDTFPDEFSECHRPCSTHAVSWYAMEERSYAGSEADCVDCQANPWAAGGSIPYKTKARLSKRYAAFCKRTGETQIKDAPQVWARSFVLGYVSEIRDRLQAIADGRDVSVGAGLVLAGRDDVLKEAFYELRPEARPHPDTCDCDTCHRAKCRERITCQRTVCVEARKPIRASAYRYVTYSHQARTAGRQAGATADLSGRNSKVTGAKGAIG